MTLLDSTVVLDDQFNDDPDVKAIREAFDEKVERIHEEASRWQSDYAELRSHGLPEGVPALLDQIDELLRASEHHALNEEWTARAALLASVGASCNKLEHSFKRKELADVLRGLIGAPQVKAAALQKAADDCQAQVTQCKQELLEALEAEQAAQIEEALAEIQVVVSPGGTAAEAGDPSVTSPGQRIQDLRLKGRQSARQPLFSRRVRRLIIVVVVAAIAAAAVGFFIANSGSSPGYTLTQEAVLGQINKACKDPDVISEPLEVNFACARATRKILDVFAALTSGFNKNFADEKTGRVGLEPITPAQGGEIAWALNLHHPYDPTNPIDSLAVAARAINNIIGGATLTNNKGKPSIQNGLEAYAKNCLRYTGSGALTKRTGFPSLCAKRVTTAGQAALVHDVFRKWIVGAPPTALREVVTLYEVWRDPGSPTFLRIMKHLHHALKS